MAARLQHQLHDFAVPKGEFLIGRGADCQLALDDALVSRRHAAIRVAADGSATVEDLGSRNGVFLNGVRIDKVEPLGDGDLVRIGSQDISFYDADDTQDHQASKPRQMRVTMQEIPGVSLLAARKAAAAAAAGPPSSGPILPPPDTATPSKLGANIKTSELQPVDPDDVGEQTTIAQSPFNAGAGAGRMGNGLAIIGSVADKALALGRIDDAERILQRSLFEIRDRATRGEADLETAERAVGYAIRLVIATSKGVWVDYIFQLYTIMGALLPARLVDELYAAVRKVKHTDKSVLRAYTARLKEISAGFGPAERFVQQRIEGFERWAP
jgi:hypothetical protein